MKKFISLTITVLLVLATAFSATACGGGSGNKTILNVYNYGGGFGSAWLDSLEERFESDFATYSFEEGKEGVDIRYEDPKTNGMDEVNSISGSGVDVYFCQEINYYDAAVVKKAFLDITDIVTETLTEYGEDKAIKNKFTAEQEAYLNINGKYYGIPHYLSNMGITYDVDFFDANNLYFAKNGGFVSNSTDMSLRSAGPDGDLTTEYDNGLPATYDEFMTLCSKISTLNGAIPVFMKGAADAYLHQFICSLYADYEGTQQMMLNFNFNGNAKDLVKNYNVDAYGKVTDISFEEATAINNATGYKLVQQAGRLYALSFLQRLKTGGYIYFADEGHTEAQYSFLESKIKSQGRAAMFIDGNYWIEEARTTNTFDNLVDEYDESFALENRRLAYMPLPKADASKVGKNSMFDLLYSMSFINGTIPSNKVKCAKMFLQYANTDESLEDFTVITGTTKSLKYDMDDRYDELSFYGKSLWNYVKNSDVIYPFSQNNLYLGNQSVFMMFWPRMWTCTINNNTVEGIAGKIADSGQLTAKQAFDGLKDYYTESQWKGAYSSYISAN